MMLGLVHTSVGALRSLYGIGLGQTVSLSCPLLLSEGMTHRLGKGFNLSHLSLCPHLWTYVGGIWMEGKRGADEGRLPGL